MSDKTIENRNALVASVFEKIMEGQKTSINCHHYKCEPTIGTHERLVASVRYAQDVVEEALGSHK